MKVIQATHHMKAPKANHMKVPKATQYTYGNQNTQGSSISKTATQNISPYKITQSNRRNSQYESTQNNSPYESNLETTHHLKPVI